MASSHKTSIKRVELMSVVKSCDVDELLNITKRASGSELCDALAEFSRAHLDDFWESVYGLCTTTLLSDDMNIQDDEFSERMNRVLRSTTDLAQATVSALLAQKCDNGDKNAVKVPQSLQETVILLHGMLPNLEDGQMVLKNQMSRLFEDWWSHNLKGKQELGANTIFYLLLRSTQAKSSQSDVTRVWAMRGTLDCVGLNGEDGDRLVSLLQQCTHHPQFMTSNNGVKFLAFILALNPDLTDKLHQCIKNVLFTTPKSWHSKYGEIYFRSWQIANDNMKQKIEESCIQDLMFRAVHACRQGPHCASAALFKNGEIDELCVKFFEMVEMVMSHFHKRKTQRGVESMLVRLYAPILWRSLKVPNSDVRLNAASLMFNVFPLQDPNQHREEADAELQQQFDIMNSLLSDPVAEIRVVAVLGVGRVLSMYWELIPVQVIQSLMTCLVQDIIYDTASPAVREAVLKVMYQLCDNHLCIPMLKKVLPELGNFIHDSSEKVRVAMLDLLLKVKGLRAIKYWNIVPIEHILARLETDSRFVVQRIMSLISSSFVPINQPPSQQVERCLALISSNRGAARQFFLNLPKSLGIVDTTKYILVLCRYALESTRLWTKSCHLQSEDKNEEKEGSEVERPRKGRTNGKKRRSRSKRISDTISGDTEEEDDNSSVERTSGTETSQNDDGGEVMFNMDLLSGLMEGVYLMFTSIVSELSSSEHVAMKEGLMKKLSVTVRELIRISQDQLLEEALIGLAGHLPCRTLPLVSQSLFNKFKENLSEKEILDTNTNSDLTSVVKALVQWGRSNEMLDIVEESISAFLQKDVSNVSKGAKRSPKGGKKVAFHTEESSIDVEKTIKVLNAMISLAECRPILIKKHKKGMTSMMESMEKGIMKKLEKHLKFLADPLEETSRTLEKKKAPPSDSELELSISLSIFTSYVRLIVFLSLQFENGIEKECSKAVDTNDDDTSKTGLCKIEKCLAWILKVVSPHLCSSQDPSQLGSVASQLVGMTMKACSGLVMVGAYGPDIFRQAGQICMIILKLPISLLSNSLLDSVLCFTYQMTQIRQVQQEKDSTEPMEEEEITDMAKVLPSSPTRLPLQFALTIFESAFKVINGITVASNFKSIKTDLTPISTLYSSIREIFLALVRPGVSTEIFDKTVNVVATLIIQDGERLSCQDLIGSDEGTSRLNKSLLLCLKKIPKVMRSFIEEVIVHLESDQVSIHSLHGIVTLTDSLKANPSDAVNPNLKDAICKCLGKVSLNGVDEDIFRDVKLQVEEKTRAWTGPR